MSCGSCPEDFTDKYFPHCTVAELTTPRAVGEDACAGVAPPVEETEGSEGTDVPEENLPVDRETVEEDPGATIVSSTVETVLFLDWKFADRAFQDEVVAAHKALFNKAGPAALRVGRHYGIMGKIFTFAMSAANGSLHVASRVDGRPNGNICLGLLRVK